MYFFWWKCNSRYFFFVRKTKNNKNNNYIRAHFFHVKIILPVLRVLPILWFSHFFHALAVLAVGLRYRNSRGRVTVVLAVLAVIFPCLFSQIPLAANTANLLFFSCQMAVSAVIYAGFIHGAILHNYPLATTTRLDYAKNVNIRNCRQTKRTNYSKFCLNRWNIMAENGSTGSTLRTVFLMEKYWQYRWYWQRDYKTWKKWALSMQRGMAVYFQF